MAIFQKPVFQSESKKRDMPEGLWQKCPSCGEVIHHLALTENQRVCPKCDHHFTQSARDRLQHLLDTDSFEEHDANMTSVDTLKVKGMGTYTDRLKNYQKKTGLKDAVISGIGNVGGRPGAIVGVDVEFIAARTGSVGG